MVERSTLEEQLERIHLMQFYMLKEFDKFCKKNNLQYWLACGSVLGAVRHNGFVPWDDDIDVMMLRNDYEKMLELLPNELPGHLFLQTYKSDPEYPLFFSKIRMNNTIYQEKEYEGLDMHQGVYIDIFPIDYTSKFKIGQLYHRTKVYFYQIIRKYKYKETVDRSQKYWLIKRIIHLIAKSIDRDVLYKRMYKTYTMFIKKTKNPLIVFFGIKGKKYIMSQDTLIPAKYKEFMSIMAPIPNKYELYLTKLYGNYNELPPKEKRKPFLYHKIKYFRLSKDEDIFFVDDHRSTI